MENESFIEIKQDSLTLPSGEQKVKFKLLANEEELEGIYIEEENMFWVNDRKYYSSWDVVKWRPLDGMFPTPKTHLVTADWIAVRRQAKKLSQPLLSELTGISKEEIVMYESGMKKATGPASVALWFVLH